MLMGEVATLVKYKLPVKVVVIKNNVLGEIKWEQMAQEGNPQYRGRVAAYRFCRIRKMLRSGRLHHRRSTRCGECAATGARSSRPRAG